MATDFLTNKFNTFLTVQDMVRQRHAEKAAWDEAHPGITVAAPVQLPDPRIGTLVRNGETVYYAYFNGYHNPEAYGTLPDLVALLKKQDELQAQA